jgi:hypothetical protein
LIGYDGLFGMFFEKSKDDICSASSEEPVFRQQQCTVQYESDEQNSALKPVFSSFIVEKEPEPHTNDAAQQQCLRICIGLRNKKQFII